MTTTTVHTPPAGDQDARGRAARGRVVGRSVSRWSAAVVLSILAVGCASSDSSAPSSTSAPTTTGATESAESAETAGSSVGVVEPEVFTGPLDEFYAVPDPLPEGDPGDLIRVQDLGVADGMRSVRVMYHSRDAEDTDRAVTGIITHPTSPAPSDGWPVTSWAHGTTGLAPQCAPSRLSAPAPGFGIEGVHVATDYVGLGPVGERHPYLSGPSEGNSVIDGVRAARNLAGVDAGTRWISIGHSQGGHAALFAGERSRTHAPELDLVGTVSLAPASQLGSTYGPLDEVVSRVVGVMGLYGAASEHPDIDVADYVGPEVAAAAGVLDTGCLDEIVAAFAGIPGESFYAADPLTTEPARSVMLEQNDPGLVATGSPLFLVSGTADERVNIDRVRDLFERECAIGQETELLVVDGATHGGIIPATAPQVTSWIQARLAGEAAVDSCP